MTTDLTNSQLRMWFMHTVDPRRTDLTIGCAAELRTPMSIIELQERLGSVVLAHPQLAAVLTAGASGSPQWTEVDVLDALRSAVQPTRSAATPDQVRLLYSEFAGRPWDLEHEVPWMVQLVDTAESTVLFCRFHHIVCDGDRSLALFLDGLAENFGAERVPALTELLTDPAPAEDGWPAEIAELTSSLASIGNPRERVVDTVAGQRVHRWTASLELPEGGRDEAALLERLRAAAANLTAEQLLVAIPFDGCTGAQHGQIGYFGNPGLAVLPPAGTPAGWGEREYERAQRLAAIPFQVIMADEGFRGVAGTVSPFDILLVPRTLFGYQSALVRAVSEPVASRTPYALVLNHWRDGDHLRISVESAVFGPDALAYLGAGLLTGAGKAVAGQAIRARICDEAEDVLARLEAVVRERPDAAAIETPAGERLSYREFWAGAGALAEVLASRPIGTVAIVGDKHPNEFVCVVATHLVGGTVLRLDRDPAATRRALAGLDGITTIVHLDDGHDVDLPVDSEHTFAGPFGPCRISMVAGASASGPASAFYITLTSGSTGEPKPIPFARADFNSLIAWHLRTFPGPRRMLQFSKLSFDVAYHVIYATLCGGGTLVFGNREIREDPNELLDYIDTARIEKVYLPTVLLRPLAEFAMASGAAAASLREIIVAGGSLELTDEIRSWFARTPARLFNHYGMSETQDVASYLLAGHPETWPARPPAGPPIDGVEIRVVGGTGEELPAGLSGTVVVRTGTGETVTGDVGYRDGDGLLHILGRADRVIKLRGYRVNLQALEAQVARAPGISDAVAVAYQPGPGTTAAAVLATVARTGLDPAEIRAATRRTLGDGYDFELHFVDAIPRLPNAKPDLLELARMARELADTRTEVRDTRPQPGGSAVLQAVRELVPNAAVHERSRFLEVGLDSISLMSLAARLRQDHPGISIADFFRHPTVGELQRALEHPDRAPATPVARTADPRGREVAVVGMAGRFPGASTVDEYWANLLNGTSAVAASREPDGSFVPAHGNLSDVDSFDHAFFGLTPAEARRMDPQIRVFLEQCWAALEHAGEAGELAGKQVGIFAGGGLSTYLINEIEPERLRAGQVPFLEYNTLPERLGNDRNYLTSTVSYRLGLTGPSIVVQAACATSLTAVHLARQSLLSGECDVALAGGVSIIYPQPDGYEYVDGSVRSRHGTCRPFDREADGTVFGNGAGVVVLKRSPDAKADRNTVYAEVIGSATNHDGSVKGSFSAPNPAAQTRVIDAALRGTGPIALNFVEAHGTGTAIGDAIEWNALLGSGINAEGRCVVGSVKGSVGHLDEAAGIAGFIKACLAVRHRIYPGTYGFTELHPALAESDRFTVSGKNNELPDAGSVHGAVSSFGMGGANCHVVLRSSDTGLSGSATQGATVAEHPDSLYLPVSARSSTALTQLSGRLAAELDRQGRSLPAASVVHTLGSGRRHFEEHRGVLHRAGDIADLVTVPDRPTEIVWAFPGQGSGFDWTAVAELRHWPVFAGTFDELLGAFTDRLGADLFAAHVGRRVDGSVLAPPEGECAQRCTIREQVLQFSFQLALATLLGSFGIEPDVVTGHSLGEITAAVCAGRVAEAAALDLVAERSRLMELATPNGFMLQLGCDAGRAMELTESLDLDVAALNGPQQTVVAGDPGLEEELRRRAAAEDIAVVRLPVGKAFHSRLMVTAAEQLGRLEVDWAGRRSGIEFVSANPGHDGDPAELAYWTSQLTSPVDYLSAATAILARSGRACLMELGFGATLSNLVRATASAGSVPVPALVNGLKKSVPHYVARATAAAYQAGREPRWAELNQLPGGELIPLPSYPFARTEIAPYRATGAGQTRTPDAGFTLCPNDEDWILEHQVDGRCVVPAAGILVLLARAVGRDDVALADISFERPIDFDSPADRIEARVSVGSGPQQEIALWTRPMGATEWVRNASAMLATDVPATEPGEVAAGAARRIPAEELYGRFSAQRLTYGPSYRNLDDILTDAASATANWAPPNSLPRSRIGVPAGLVAGIDGVIQLADVLSEQAGSTIRMPAYLAAARVRLAEEPGPVQRVHARALPAGKASGALRHHGSGVLADLSEIRFQVTDAPEPVAHTLRWRERITVGAGLPAAVAEEIERLRTDLSEQADVEAYQQELRLLESYALRILDAEGGSEYVRSLDGSADRIDQRRARVFAEFLSRADTAPAGPLPDTVGSTVHSEWSILRTAAASLARYFDGSIDGESILFGGDGAEQLRAYYQSSFLLNRLNNALRRVVASVASAAARPVRILEVGGGTGASTEGILESLRELDVPVDYTFTDLSEGLIRLAGERFRDYPGFRATALDLDSDESVAALDGDYDVVVAVDVIHATTDIARTIDRLRDRMAPNGMLLLVEDLKQLAWIDLTFGLLDSWWSHDDALRAGHPLLDLDQWRSLLFSRFGQVDELRACAGLSFEETVADEGLFLCANPARQSEVDGSGTVVLRFDTGPVLDPDEAERFAGELLRALREAEDRPEVRTVVLCTTDAMLVDGSPRVLTAGAMAAALARVATAEDRRVRTFALALDAAPDNDSALHESVRTLLVHGHPHVNGVIADGRLYLPSVAPDPATSPEVDHDAIVVFGGNSDLGHAAVEWFAAKGIRRAYLVTRGTASESTVDFASRMSERGTEVRCLTADVTDAGAVRAIARTVAGEATRPLVLNLAAVLRDGTIGGIGDGDLASVFGPKVRGSHTIDAAFRDTGATIVLFSSTSALLGNAGQAAHAMACAYLDGLAEWRTTGGPVTASVQWGPWEDVGITARQGMNDGLRRAGELPSPASVFLPELARAATGPGGSTIAADLSSPAIRRHPSLTALLPPLRSITVHSGVGVDRETLPDFDGTGDVVGWAVASVLGVAPGEVADDLSLADNGIDSLNLIEVRSLIERRTGVRVPLNALSDAPSVAAVRDAVVPAGEPETVTHTVFYVAGIFGRVDAAPDLEAATSGSARVVTMSSPTRAEGEPGRLDIAEVAKDLADQVEREQPAGALTVVGHSFGAMLAYSTGVELRRRGRELARLVVIDGEPVGAPSAAKGTPAEFEKLLRLSDSGGGSLRTESRAIAFDAYRANCEIARSEQTIGELSCPIVVAVPERHVGVGLTASTVAELRWTAREKLGGESIDVVRVPGDHFTMLRSPNVEHLVKHIIVDNPGR